jgi:hypothetical protein
MINTLEMLDIYGTLVSLHIFVWGRSNSMAIFGDDILKRMFAAHTQQFLTWLLPGVLILHELSSELKRHLFWIVDLQQTDGATMAQ